MGSSDRFEPTYHADTKQFSLEWRHEVGSANRALTTTVDQRDETVAMEVSEVRGGGVSGECSLVSHALFFLWCKRNTCSCILGSAHECADSQVLSPPILLSCLAFSHD